jgi:hypothetical protein
MLGRIWRWFGFAYHVLAVVGLTLLPFRSVGEPPSIEHIFPAGFSRNLTHEATVAGKLDPWPPKVWVSCPGITLTAETNKGQFRVEVAADAPVGAHLLRFFNEDGSSAPRIFVVSEQPETLEKEPNDHFKKAQSIAPLPATVNGRLNKAGDVDSFAVSLQAGQWLEARLDAYTLGSKMDALLRLVTPDGVQQSWNHDFVSLDPRLSWQAPSNGTYIIQVMAFKYPADAEVRLTGGDGCVYRLHLDALACPPDLFAGGTPECELNNSPANARVVSLPATLRGAIEYPGDEDCFGFTLAKDENVEINVEAASLGSSLDAWVKLLDASGKELARNEDNGRFRDPRLEWKAGTNGTFYAVIGNMLHSGGAGYSYRLSLRHGVPDYRPSVAAGSITITPGETNEVKVTLTRSHGFDRKLTARLQGLPDGTRADQVDVPGNSGEAILKLVTAPDAKPAQLPVRIVITDATTSEQRPALFSLISASEDNGVPGGLYETACRSDGPSLADRQAQAHRQIGFQWIRRGAWLAAFHRLHHHDRVHVFVVVPVHDIESGLVQIAADVLL